MATGSRKIEKVAVTTYVEKESTDVVLVLSQEEASFLFDVSARTGGCPKKSRRRLMDNIQGALIQAGFKYGYWDTSDFEKGENFGSLRLKSET